MEHIIVSQIMKHLEDQNILSDRQFGFRSNHSCESQLFITINDIARQIVEKSTSGHSNIRFFQGV